LTRLIGREYFNIQCRRERHKSYILFLRSNILLGILRSNTIHQSRKLWNQASLSNYKNYGFDPYVYTSKLTLHNHMLFFISMGRDYVSDLRPPTGLLFIPRWYKSMYSHCGMTIKGKNRKTRRKPVSMPLFHHKFHMDWPQVRTRASAARNRRLSAWACS
jgi:hypothetical protein